MTITEAKKAIDSVINKARVHLYKPIQIAEILYKDRTEGIIDLSTLETYRTRSRKWRDIVCINFLGRSSTSSAKYQDDIFNKDAVPPETLAILGKENRDKNGIVEKYIYDSFSKRYTQMNSALSYCLNHTKDDFILSEFINLFWQEAGLKRSIDKIYEIVVYSLFRTLIEEIQVKITISYEPSKIEILKEFEDFAEKVIGINSTLDTYTHLAKINRVGVTNAADSGFDIFANFGTIIQVKHLSLNERLAEDIVMSVSSDRIVIVCLESEEKVIVSLLSQIGWRARIQSIITENELLLWYEKAMRGTFGDLIGEKLLSTLKEEIINEFPSTENTEFNQFYSDRGYDNLSDTLWQVD